MLKANDIVVINYFSSYVGSEGEVVDCDPGDIVKILSVEYYSHKTSSGVCQDVCIKAKNLTKNIIIKLSGNPSYTHLFKKDSVIKELF